MSGQRKAFSRGQMTKGANSGPAVMLMPPHIRATFMPNPPLEHKPIVNMRRRQVWTGVSQYLDKFEKTAPPERVVNPTPKALKEKRKKLKKEAYLNQLEPKVETYRQEQRDSGGEFQGMNCYNTLFIGRLAFEVTERKLLREMEAFGSVKDIKIVKDKEGKSKGFAFVEYEHEDDMKRAYRAADGMKIEGRHIVVDVERGHTVPSWLPRRLGGGLGGTRLGGKDVNYTRPGRFDPSRPEASAPPIGGGGHPGMGRGQGPPPPQYGYGGGGGGFRDGPPPGPPPYSRGGGGYGGPQRGSWYGGGDDYNDRKRRRDPSPDRDRDRRYGGGGRRRY